MSYIAPPSPKRRDGLAATNLANSSTKNKRRELDFYPTPPACTVALLDFLNLPMNTVIWEPACGEGAIVDVCRQYGYPTVGTDIINGMDFLTCTNAPCHNWIITNPPFNLSEKFIERAASIPNTKFAFLLKSQFWHARKRLDIFRLHPPAYILPLTWRPDFMGGERGGAPTMEVLWTVWTGEKGEAKYIPLERPKL